MRAGGASALAAVDEAAAALGLHPGMTLATARAIRPDLAMHEADPAADRALLCALADRAERWTPLVGLDGDDALLLDITGAAHLFGGERNVIEDALSRFGRLGFSVRAAVAGTAAAARAVAECGGGGIVPPGGEAEAVAGLPVAALRLDAATQGGLLHLGLKTVGDLASRPRAPLAARFGRVPLDRLDLLRGLARAPISPRRTPPACIAERRFAEPIGRQEDVRRTILVLAADLARILERRGEGARALELVFFRADGAMRSVTVEAGRPLREPAGVLRLFGERLDALADPLDPGFGFDVIRLSALALEALSETAVRLDRGPDFEAELSALIDRLAARFGTRRVLRPAARDTHLPERAALFLPAQQGNAALAADWTIFAPEADAAPPRPVRLMDPPERIDVLAEVPDGPPVRFRLRRVLHAVVKAEGPERIAPEWWRAPEGTPTRDYFRVEDAEGRRFWLFRDGLYGRETDRPHWYLHGVFA